jgi:light-regulated signal transduction histidine kinase (bacteriophytochrome)
MVTKKKTTKALEASTIEVAEVTERVSRLKKVDVIAQMGMLQVATAETIADIQAKVGGAMSALDEINGLIEVKQGRLVELHEIEGELLAIDEIRSRREEAEEAYAQEVIAREQNRVREEIEYNYQLSQVRRKANDTYNDKMAMTRRSEEYQWAAQGVALDAREAMVDAESLIL